MKRTIIAVAVVSAVSAMAIPLSAAPASAAGLPNVGYSTSAYGSYVNLAGKVTSGPTALSGVSCTSTAGLSVHGTIGTVTVPAAATVGAATTTGTTSATTAQRTARSTAKVTGINLLDGRITADAITTSSASWATTAGTYAGYNTMSLVNLRIMGQAIDPAVPPNTKISLGLPGETPFGSVVVNSRSKAWADNIYQTSTVALVVTISGTNPMGLPLGSRVNVAYSRASITKPIVGFVGGSGASTWATLADGTVKSSSTALANVPCTGGTSTANVAGVTIPGLATTGTAQTDTSSTVTAYTRSAKVHNSTATPNLLAGLITAQAVVADVGVTRAGVNGPVSLTDASKFVGLKISGVPAITDAVKPNTVINLDQLGKVTLHKVTTTPTGITVTMIEVVLNQPIGGLPTGSVIRIGMANVRVL